MKWKTKRSNLIVVSILSLAYTIVTLLIIIGPLHMNNAGHMNALGILSFIGVIYWLFSLSLSWCLYFALRSFHPEALYFALLVVGIILIITEVFLWGWFGSSY